MCVCSFSFILSHMLKNKNLVIYLAIYLSLNEQIFVLLVFLVALYFLFKYIRNKIQIKWQKKTSKNKKFLKRFVFVTKIKKFPIFLFHQCKKQIWLISFSFSFLFFFGYQFSYSFYYFCNKKKIKLKKRKIKKKITEYANEMRDSETFYLYIYIYAYYKINL